MIIQIDGRDCACEKGELLLEIAKRYDITIPTLCHHESLAGQGCCRVCIVEVEERGYKKVVVSCVYPVEKECSVWTDSPRIRRERGMILTMLRLRAPESPEIAALCNVYAAPQLTRLKPEQTGKCILCGLCVRACTQLGAGAISTINRGVTKAVDTPYHEASSVCIGCGSCASVCPTGAIDVAETETARTIWGKQFDLVRCRQCGKVMGTEEELLHAAKKAGTEAEHLCAACRQAKMARVFADTFGAG